MVLIYLAPHEQARKAFRIGEHQAIFAVRLDDVQALDADLVEHAYLRPRVGHDHRRGGRRARREARCDEHHLSHSLAVYRLLLNNSTLLPARLRAPSCGRERLPRERRTPLRYHASYATFLAGPIRHGSGDMGAPTRDIHSRT